MFAYLKVSLKCFSLCRACYNSRFVLGEDLMNKVPWIYYRIFQQAFDVSEHCISSADPRSKLWSRVCVCGYIYYCAIFSSEGLSCAFIPEPFLQQHNVPHQLYTMNMIFN